MATCFISKERGRSCFKLGLLTECTLQDLSTLQRDTMFVEAPTDFKLASGLFHTLKYAPFSLRLCSPS